MGFGKCNKCGDYRINPENCNCKAFEIIDKDGEECHPVYAIDEEEAALKFAETSNSEGDYYLMNESVVINVNGIEFNISAEPDIHYSAFKVK